MKSKWWGWARLPLLLVDPLGALYARMNSQIGDDGIRRLMAQDTGNEALALACVDFCRSLSTERRSA